MRAAALVAVAMAAFGLGWLALDLLANALQASTLRINRAGALAAKAPWLALPLAIVVAAYLVAGRGRPRPRGKDVATAAAIAFVIALGSGSILL